MTSDNAKPSSVWRSFHIFLWHAAKADRFLAQVMLPRLMREGKSIRWFFIRYWEGGPHIRLRLQANDSVVKGLIADLARAAQDYLSPGLLDPDRYYRGNVFERPVEDIGAMPWFEEGAVEQIAYQPETSRYGGPEALAHQERLFELSSRLAAKIIIATQDSWPRRAHFAIQMMIAAASSAAGSGDAASRFFLSYASYWKPFARGDHTEPLLLDYEAISRDIRAPGSRRLPQIWFAALERANAALLGLSAEYKLLSPQTGHPVESVEDAQEALRAIVSSQIHMLNNRLGVGPDREHAFALALSASVSSNLLQP